MGRREREEAALETLARKVWGDSYYERYRREHGRRPRRLGAKASVVIGVQLLVGGLVLMLFPAAASAHSSTIDITCSHVRFNYVKFPSVPVTSVEVVTIDSSEFATKTFAFNGPTATDTIPITVGNGMHTVVATDQWTFDGAVRGSANASLQLSDCGSTTTTTTTTVPGATTTTTVPGATTTTVPGATTTTVPGATTTTVPGATTTTTAPSGSSTTTTEPGGGTTTTAPGGGTTTTIGTQGSTTTVPGGSSTTFGSQGSTSPTTGNTFSSTMISGQGVQSSTTAAPLSGSLPFTGSNGRPFVGALVALGVGLLALGLARLRAGVDHN
jgi:hypothetical protein